MLLFCYVLVLTEMENWSGSISLSYSTCALLLPASELFSLTVPDYYPIFPSLDRPDHHVLMEQVCKIGNLITLYKNQDISPDTEKTE
jgi:hypothetical protein